MDADERPVDADERPVGADGRLIRAGWGAAGARLFTDLPVPLSPAERATAPALFLSAVGSLLQARATVIRFVPLFLLAFLGFGCAVPTGPSAGIETWAIQTDFPARPSVSTTTERMSSGPMRLETSVLTDGDAGESLVAIRSVFPSALSRQDAINFTAGLTASLLKGFGGTGKLVSRRTVMLAEKPALRLRIEYSAAEGQTSDVVIIVDGASAFTFQYSRRSSAKDSPAGVAFLKGIRRGSSGG